MCNSKKISSIAIVIPVYNESSTIGLVIEKVLASDTVGLKKKIIVVDDGSTDSNIRYDCEGIVLIRNEKNCGKGFSIRRALEYVDEDIVLIQDADLEYDPENYSNLIRPFIENGADVVYGNRFCGNGVRRVLLFRHEIANRILTFISNIFTGINLTDMEVGYKVFRTDVLKSISLNENRFGFEPEVTSKIAKIKDVKIYEVGISYFGRTYKDGKKIRFKDAIVALWCIVKYSLSGSRNAFKN